MNSAPLCVFVVAVAADALLVLLFLLFPFFLPLLLRPVCLLFAFSLPFPPHTIFPPKGDCRGPSGGSGVRLWSHTPADDISDFGGHTIRRPVWILHKCVCLLDSETLMGCGCSLGRHFFPPCVCTQSTKKKKSPYRIQLGIVGILEEFSCILLTKQTIGLTNNHSNIAETHPSSLLCFAFKYHTDGLLHHTWSFNANLLFASQSCKITTLTILKDTRSNERM